MTNTISNGTVRLYLGNRVIDYNNQSLQDVERFLSSMERGTKFELGYIEGLTAERIVELTNQKRSSLTSREQLAKQSPSTNENNNDELIEEIRQLKAIIEKTGHNSALDSVAGNYVMNGGNPIVGGLIAGLFRK